MATVKVSFDVTPKKLSAYALDIALASVPLSGGKGSIRLETGKIHTAVWRMRGNPGGSIGITFMVEGDKKGEQVLVKESKIRSDKIDGVGFADISL